MSCIGGFDQRLETTKRDRFSQKSVRCLRDDGRHISSQYLEQKHPPGNIKTY